MIFISYNLNKFYKMEKSNSGCTLPTFAENIFKKYHKLTSPLVSLSVAKKQDKLKEELRNNVSRKIECMTTKGPKMYTQDNSKSFAELKAGAALYHIPQFSTPQINFQVSEHIKKQVEDAKNQIISYLPEISRTSNFAPKKVEHQLSHRTAVRQLESWLREKLKNPPISCEQSVQYKNMIMGIGMKELIRIIGKRCTEEGRMAEEIWELTWSICRQIILYLSKRAKKCEELLEQEMKFMRTSYQQHFDNLNSQNLQLKVKMLQLEEQNKQYFQVISKFKKERHVLQEQNKILSQDNFHFKSQFKNVLEENLAIYLQIGDKNKRGWIKKMYKNLMKVPSNANHNPFKQLYKQQITEAISERNMLEKVTEDCYDKIQASEIETIQKTVQVHHQDKLRQKMNKKVNLKKNQKDTTMVTESEVTQPQNSINNISIDDDSSEEEFDKLVCNMREEFKPANASVQTDQKVLVHANTGTTQILYASQSVGVNSKLLNILRECGVNTQEIKQEPKSIKKKGKQNPKEQMFQTNFMKQSKERSKIFYASPVKQKSKNKLEKDKKIVLDVVQQQKLVKKQSQEEILLKRAKTTQNECSDALNSTDTKPLQKTNSFVGKINVFDPVLKANSTIMSSQLAREIQRKTQHYIQQEFQEQNSKQKNITLNKYDQVQASIKQQQSQCGDLNRENIDQNSEFHPLQSQHKWQNQKILTKMQTKDCTMYICAECNKIIMGNDQKFDYVKKNKYDNLDKDDKLNMTTVERHSLKRSPSGSSVKLSPEAQFAEDKVVRNKLKRVTKKISTYIHDIGFKKDIEQQLKSNFYSLGNAIEKQQDQELISVNIYTKFSPYRLLVRSIQEANKLFINNILNNQYQVTENLENYFEIVKEINSLPEAKINMTEKLVISTIEKNIFPIISELLQTVKKAAKMNRITEVMKNFTSLPNIIYNRVGRKYGVKILAIKNLKIILMALRAANKFTEKYKIIQLMMFTDCKSPQSQDLFMYLLIMGMLDPTFSSNKMLNQDELYTIRQLCEDYLAKDPSIYSQFDKLNKQQIEYEYSNGPLLNDVIKSLITSYRISKINRIEEIGFIFLMLKKDNSLDFKLFIYFLSTINIQIALKLKICKDLLELCDIKNKNHRIGISENMFSKFLMNCDMITFDLLDRTLLGQLQNYNSDNKQIVARLSNQFFTTVKEVKTIKTIVQRNSLIVEDQDQKQKQEDNNIQPVSIVQMDDISQQANRTQEIEGSNILCIEHTKVLRQIKQYSSFTFHICKYLQNNSETQYLSIKQRDFIKNYLIVHIVESSVEKVIGLVDYFSSSLLELVCTSLQEFKIKEGK